MKKNRKFKNLFKKLGKTNPYYRFLFIVLLTLYVISVVLISYSILLLSGIESLYRGLAIVAFVLYVFIFLIAGLALLISRKHGWLIFISVLTLIFTGINAFGFYYIDKTYAVIDDISKEQIVYTTDLIALSKDTEIKNVGLIKNEKDVEGYILPQEYMATNSKKYKITYYDDYISLLKALYDKEVDAIFISSNYVLQYSGTEGFENIATDTVVIDSLSKKMDNQDTVSSTNKSVTEPFTMLLLGVDSEYDGLSNNAAFNGDSIMLITFNPKTLSATVFSIPRDTYVPIACNNNKSNKINSAAAYGTSCMINTIQNLTDVTIDYFVKINFKGVVALVEALDGITMDIDEPDFDHNLSAYCGEKTICEQNSNREFGNNTVYIKPGKNVKLNGEQALAYARDRHQWAMSDFKRVEHQQAVVTAIANKAKTIRNIDTFYKLLNAVSNNIDSNMSTKEMLNFYNVGKSALTQSNFGENEFISIQKTYLSGYDLSVFNGWQNMYTFQYYKESMDEISTAMKVNLGLQKPELIKTFSFSANEEYVVPVIGKNYTSATRNETLPDFTGSSISYVESWASSRSLSLSKNYINRTDCTNDTVLSQGIHSGILVSSVSSLDLNVCKNIQSSTTTNNTSDNNTYTNTETNNNTDDINNDDLPDVLEP